MDWIKKHYDQFALALLALVLLAASALLIARTRSFGQRFADVLTQPPPKDTVPPLDLTNVEAAQEAIRKPPAWDADWARERTPKRGSLFVSQRYVIGKPSGIPEKEGVGSVHTDSLTGKQIPNQWFLENRLPLFDPAAGKADSDRDGFLNEDEWRDATDPNDKNSHPAFYTKLFLKQWVKTPFRLVFRAYDADPAKVPVESITFQINTIDVRQPSLFLKIGDKVPNTKFQLQKFEYKIVKNPTIGDERDVSVLTVINTESNEPVPLILNQVTDSPDSSGVFDYQWPPPQNITVRKLQFFALPPNTADRYKLVDIQDSEAQIQLPSGKSHTVIRDPRKK